MSWIKQSDELYINDQTFFSLEKMDGIWYVINNKDNFKSIPFTDIFNNPVFPIDLSNVDLIVKSIVSTGAISGNSLDITNTATAKHFRAEGSNTPTTPGFSFQGDINTGFFRKSEDTFGFSAGGIQYGEFGVGYGGFTGNIIQVVNSINTYKQLITNTSYQDLLSGIGVVWETSITPKYANSKILIIQNVQGLIYIAASTNYFGIGISKKISTGSYNLILDPSARQYGMAGGGLGSAYLNNQFINYHLDDASTTNIISYKLSLRVISGSTFYLNDYAVGTNTFTSTITLMEIQQ